MLLSQIQNTIESLSGIGPATTKLFAKMDIFTVGDLLQTFPRNYEDRTQRVSLCQWEVFPKVHTICKVIAHEWFGYGNMKTLKIRITDETAEAYLIAFNRPFLKNSLPEESIISVTGKFEEKYGSLQCTSFDAERLAFNGDLEEYKNTTLPDSKIFPIYPLTEGLTQKQFRKAVALALKQFGKAVDDELPEEIIEKRHLLHKKDALFYIHSAQTQAQIQTAKYSLIYEELYKFEERLAERIIEHRGKLIIPEQSDNTEDSKTISKDDFYSKLSPRQKQLMERLPFELTKDQMKVILEMNEEIDRSQNDRNTLKLAPFKFTRQPFSMQRLLQGDVGSGKTLTAFFIALRAIDISGQVAILAPTELLAKQHADNASKLLSPLGVNVAFLTGNLKASGRQYLINALKDGVINLVIGTHALFSSNVHYQNLTLAIIDEQHKFGVMQRDAIVSKGRITNEKWSHSPDLLMMSATPIPQSLALTAYGDLDVSTVKTMPGGRKSVTTYLSAMGHESNVYEAVRKELKDGHQAYFVYPRIDEGETVSDLKSAETMYKFLSKEVYPEFKCALIHSKVDEESQSKILDDFRCGKIQVLIATTVVEVGVDVANATCMIIEHAERFGLAELHQLRGRVGRSNLQSYCFLIYSTKVTDIGKERLKAIRESYDGFKIAEQDLKLRGPGEIFGNLQSGNLALKIADLERDKDILLLAREDAFMQRNQQ